MTLAAIGTAIGTVAKAAIAAVGSLSLGQAIALGTVIGVAGYTAYVLIKHTKQRLSHAKDKKAKERTVTEQILDQDTEELDTDSMTDEELLASDPADSIGLADFLRPDRKKAKKKTTANRKSTQSLFDRVKDFAEGKIDPEGYKKKKEKEERKHWSNAQWAEYYRDQMHRMNDSPEDYAYWKDHHIPMTEDRKYRKFREQQRKREIRVKEGEMYPIERSKKEFDLDRFEKSVIREDNWQKEKYRRHRNKPLSEIPFNMLDYR